jgi:hypothetical protein
VVAPLLVWASAVYGFAAAMLGATAVMLAILAPLAALWIRSPAVAAVLPASGVLPVGSPTRLSKRDALRDFAFWTVAGPFALALIAQVGFIVHQIAFLDPLLGRAGVAAAIAVTTIMAVVGRVGLGFVIDRLDQRRASALSFASQGIALGAMTLSDNPALLFIACAAFGFSVGNLITFPSLILQREFDAASFTCTIARSVATKQSSLRKSRGLLRFARNDGDISLVRLQVIGAAATCWAEFSGIAKKCVQKPNRTWTPSSSRWGC